jgi:hypothetical protein
MAGRERLQTGRGGIGWVGAAGLVGGGIGSGGADGIMIGPMAASFDIT